MKAKQIEGMEEANDVYEGRAKSGRARKGKRSSKRKMRRKGGR